MKVILVIVVILLLVAACIYVFLIKEPTNLGDSKSGFTNPPQNVHVDAQTAVQLAQPFLENSYALRRKMRGEIQQNPNREPVIRLLLKGAWYFVSLDDYPSMTNYYYLQHAVRVHTDTGQVIPPSP
ncbi:MAG: hypothetical protein JNL11_13350 [Bdellovibrionaceae bacterium]|nr:hypothetical protein [Pseudobdellovibrionaceae bacterium]